MSSTRASPDPTGRNRGERRYLWLTLLALAALLAWARWHERASVDEMERSRLALQARAVDQNLARQLQGVYAALLDLRRDMPAWPEAERRARVAERLIVLSEAVPGVRTMLWLDAGGQVLASSGPELMGQDFSSRTFFSTPRARPDPGVLYVSEPFLTLLGAYSLNFSMALTASDGAFSGIVSATLDPAYFSTVLGSVLYAPDMWAALVHPDGLVLVQNPPDVAARGLNVARPDTPFSRHLQSGRPASVFVGTALNQGDDRVMALRTLQPAALQMDKPLVLTLSRNLQAVYADWLRETVGYAVLYALLFAGSWAALLALQRRRSELERLGRERQLAQAADAERLTLALHGANLGLWDLDVPSGLATVNERWFTMLGLRPGDLFPDLAGWLSVVHPDDQARAAAAQQAHLAGHTDGYEASYRMRHSDGHWVWVLDRGRVLERDAAGAPLRMLGTHMDVTERMQGEDALRESERKSRTLLENLRAGVVVHGADTRVVDANPSACRLLGLSVAQMRGMVATDPGWSFVEEDLSPMAVARYPVNQAMAGAQTLNNFVLGVQRPDLDHPYWLLCNAYLLFNDAQALEQVVVTFTDITERVQAAAQLRLLEASIARLNDIVLITEIGEGGAADSLIVFVNDAFERLTGYRRDEVIGRSPRVLQGPGTDQAEVARIALALRQRQPVRAELLNYSKAGEAYWIEMDIVPVTDTRGRVTHMVAVERDITERKRAEARILAAQGELEATLAAIPDLLFEIDIDGRIASCHSPRRELLYVPPEQFQGRTVAEVLPAEAAAVVMRALRQAQETGFSSGLQYFLVIDERSHWFELSVSRKPVGAGERPRFMVLARDVSERHQAETERRVLESQLREAQKMESIGTLAGGIAHDFNNILAAILGNVALARQELGAGHGSQASLDQIQKSGLRARSLVQQILSFSRREPQALRRQALRPVIDETLALLRATLPAGVRLETRLDDGLPAELDADATQLQQVLMNLCTNAWHALPAAGGRIEVGLESVDADSLVDPQSGLPPAGLPAGRCIHLWVRDNGSGMDATTRSRIFDPFFTTKPVGQGTGLGLSVVHGIVRAHRGAIVVDSEPGAGSTFHLYFPWSLATAEAAGGGSPPAALALHGSGQEVLYIDDDDVMVQLVERLLQGAGFRCTGCTDAAQALDLLRADPLRFEVVVTDYNMPEMSGLEVARAVALLHPGLPVVISTGHVSDTLRAEIDGAGVSALLRKENTFEELAALVHELLSGSAVARAPGS